ncbi:MAG: bifunctional adenosylcobinamide kinase/adenosylcobinamide-phosphate guanylyltransferase [Bacteroidales bacterium]|jgi:adenosylcobinamide kinase/adenosylcobinamide-phosphate guanylyltransferase|nr:bifunctional adenosylcobinamide kinase/adenosylcobinamide-phosphate guanylyltransferase [Bacteroidales bacterium]
MKKIILVTGGQRSGKSTYAEKLALELAAGEQAVYMATSRIWDEEFAHRVQLHKDRRGPQWINLEEEKYLGRHNVAGRVVLIDCVTLWSTNFFFDLSTEDSLPDNAGGAVTTMSAQQAQDSATLVERTLQQIKAEFEKFTSQDATFIFVTNEIGLSGVSENKVQRQFTDLLGWLNQYIASKADEVVFMVSGIPMKIK